MELLLIPFSLIVGFALAILAVRIGFTMGRETQGLATGRFPWREDAPGRPENDSGYPDAWEEAASPLPNKGIETVER